MGGDREKGELRCFCVSYFTLIRALNGLDRHLITSEVELHLESLHATCSPQALTNTTDVTKWVI